MPAFQRILVPVDGSDTSNKALVAALQMAREAGGRVRLLHSFDELAFLSGYEYSGEAVQLAREQAQRVLSDAQAMADAAGVPCDSTLCDSAGQRLGESVADEAQRWTADLIVIGSHGRRGVQRVLLGSGAEQIARDAPVPVLIIPARSLLRRPEGQTPG